MRIPSLRLLRLALSLSAALAVACGTDAAPESHLPAVPTSPADAAKPDSDHSVIRLLRVGGATPVDLTAGSGPVWSPDGSRIAFTSARDGTFQIYVINRDGTGLAQLTRDAATSAQPRWSMDGSKIAYVHDHRVQVMSSDGSGKVTVATLPSNGFSDFGGVAFAGAWSPDALRLAYFWEDGSLHLVNVDGSGERALARGSITQYSGAPAWSPDGGSIAFLSTLGASCPRSSAAVRATSSCST